MHTIILLQRPIVTYDSVGLVLGVGAIILCIVIIIIIMVLLLALTLLLFAGNIVLVHLLILQAINHYYGEACHNIIILQCYSLMPIHNGIVICISEKYSNKNIAIINMAILLFQQLYRAAGADSHKETSWSEC